MTAEQLDTRINKMNKSKMNKTYNFSSAKVKRHKIKSGNKESEFGRGLTYCLGLFLCHTERIFGTHDMQMRDIIAGSWFYGAHDHLYEISLEGYSPKIVKKVEELIEYSLSFRYKKATPGDVIDAKMKALEILRMIDEKELDQEVIRGSWE